MWPWGHAAVAYLGYLIYARVARYTPTDVHGWPVMAVLVGSQGPDVIDKPLTWTFPVLDSGRSVGHSLVVWAVLSLVAVYLAKRYWRRSIGVAFSVAYFTHPFADGYQAILAGNWERVTYLAWPLLPAPHYPHEKDRSIIGYLLQADIMQHPVQLALVGIAILLAISIEYIAYQERQKSR